MEVCDFFSYLKSHLKTIYDSLAAFLGNTKPKNVSRVTLLPWILENNHWTEFSILPNWLMPSAKHNLTMDKGLLAWFLCSVPRTCLFNNHSCYNACIMKLTFVLLCIPFLFPLLHKWRFTFLHGVASLFALFFVWYLTNCLQNGWQWNVMVHTFSCRFLGVACVNLPYFPLWLDPIPDMIFMLLFIHNAM